MPRMSKQERERINAQGYTFIARGPLVWGEGETAELAVKRCKSLVRKDGVYAGKKGTEYHIEVFKAPTTAHVDRYGWVIPSDRDHDGTYAPLKPTDHQSIDLIEEKVFKW